MGFLAFVKTFAFLLGYCSVNTLVFQKRTGTEYLPLEYNFKFSSRLKYCPLLRFLRRWILSAESTTGGAFVDANDPFR